MCFQNLIDTGQLKPLRFHLEGVRRGGVRGWEEDEGGAVGCGDGEEGGEEGRWEREQHENTRVSVCSTSLVNK